MRHQVRVFINDLLKQSGVELTPPDVREQMIDQLEKRLEAKLTLAAINNLPEDKIAEFKSLLADNASEQVLTAYLNNNIPDINLIFEKAQEEFRNLHIGK